MTGRERKKELKALLKQPDVTHTLSVIRKLPPKQIISPLIGLLCDMNETVKWHTVAALGVAVSGLADSDMESGRVVMRRLMWHLNEESGGIGWGAPEAMGEIMANHQGLAGEFSRILVSYIRPGSNFIENGPLQHGVLWGIGRLGYSHPQSVADAAELLAPFLRSEDPLARGLAAYAAGAMPLTATKPLLRNMTNDNAEIGVFLDGRLIRCTVERLAVNALNR